MFKVGRNSQIPNCPKCEGINIVHNGKTVRGKQRYLCNECRTQFSNVNWNKNKFTVQERCLILFLYVSGVERVNIARFLDVKPAKVGRCIKSLQKEMGNDFTLPKNSVHKVKSSASQYFISNHSKARHKELLLEVKLLSNTTNSMIAIFSDTKSK